MAQSVGDVKPPDAIPAEDIPDFIEEFIYQDNKTIRKQKFIEKSDKAMLFCAQKYPELLKWDQNTFNVGDESSELQAKRVINEVILLRILRS